MDGEVEGFGETLPRAMAALTLTRPAATLSRKAGEGLMAQALGSCAGNGDRHLRFAAEPVPVSWAGSDPDFRGRARGAWRRLRGA